MTTITLLGNTTIRYGCIKSGTSGEKVIGEQESLIWEETGAEDERYKVRKKEDQETMRGIIRCANEGGTCLADLYLVTTVCSYPRIRTNDYQIIIQMPYHPCQAYFCHQGRGEQGVSIVVLVRALF